VIIDAYTHWTPVRYVKELTKVNDYQARKAGDYAINLSREKKNFMDIDARLDDLKKFGFEKQITMVHSIIEPNTFNLSDEEGMRLSSMINDDLVDLSKKSGGKILGIGTIPLHCLESGGLEEMERAVSLGIKGFMMPTNALGKPLDSFYPALEKASKLSVPIYIHPVDTPETMGRPYEIEYDLMHVLGWPYETSVIWARLVLSGIMEKLPGLKVVTHHLGGTIPYLIGRIQESYDAKASKVMNVKGEIYSARKSPMEMIKRFYYDTAIGGNPSAIKCGKEVIGHENIVFSTDYPWGPDSGRSRMETYPDHVRMANFDNDQLEDVFYKNITKLLGL
jgi:predicted TIM-barrel fold metal-dependent hydrolase